MAYLNFKSKYDKFPNIKIDGFAQKNYQEITSLLQANLSNKNILTIECYPTVRLNEIKTNIIDKLNPELVICSDDLAFEGDKITQIITKNLTEDRVFGVMGHYDLLEFFYQEKIKQAQQEIKKTNGLVVIYGTGASLIDKGDILVYADLARWEIQQRYRSKEFSNWRMNDYDLDLLKKYKRAYFVEWRMADKLKNKLFNQIDYFLDTNKLNDPVLIDNTTFFKAMTQAIKQPFRLVPYFDPGVWGGQWMKEVCNLDPEKENYAWSFDGVPEENSIYLNINGIIYESPAINIVFTKPVELLGDKVHARFGREFPIRFDFLDTMQGGNLSLQVHPLTEYIQQQFGMHYTQDESYYILDAEEDSCVYLGVKTNINKDNFLNDLQKANKGEIIFDDSQYINKFPAKKHDHFLIPAGTIHCSGKNAMVLEISATPYIFTFKLWDWGRLGLDGLPRPVHINHGKNVIDFTRDTNWVKNNLINRAEILNEEEGILEERTGLHEREFIETRRHTFNKPVTHYTKGSVNVLNLIEGIEAIVESPTNQFKPYIIHYAETFIIPEAIKEYTIRPYGQSENQTIKTIKASIRI